MEGPPEAQMKKQGLEIRRGDPYYSHKIIPEMHVLIQDYAKINNTTARDAIHRILLDFFTAYHHFRDPNRFLKEIHKAIFPDKRAIHDAIVSIARGQTPHRRPLPLRKLGKLPFSSSESGSSDQNSP